MEPKTLPTAKGLGLSKKPCDICNKTDKQVRFYGISGLLTCGELTCNNEIERRLQEIRSLYKSNQDEDY